MKKTLTITIISILILIGGVFKVYTTLDVSEDVSPITLVKSIFELEKNNKLIYEVSSSPLKLISKENFDIISYMEKNSFELLDDKDKVSVIVKKNYSFFY